MNIADLPRGWTTAKLNDLVSFALGGDWGAEPDSLKPGFVKVRVVRGTDFKAWHTDRGAGAAERSIKLSSLEKRRLEKGDIVLEVSGGGPTQPVGRTILIDREALRRSSYPLVCSNFFRLLRFYDIVDPRFIQLFLSYAYSNGVFNEYQTETTNLRNLNVPDFLQNTYVALAPPAEQRRIVGRLHELLGKVKLCKEHLERVQRVLKRFRQSVLAAACSGRLTADWREGNPANVGSTIESIRRRRATETRTTAQQERFSQIFEITEQNDSSELPDGWRFVTLHKLATSFDYGTSAKSQKSGKVPVLRMGNIQNGKLDWNDLVYTSSKDEIQHYFLKPNTVLFNRTNSPELVGKTAIYRGERPAIFAGYLIRINPVSELDPEYLNLCLNTNYAKAFCAQVKTDGVSQSNINAQKLGNFEVPFCSLAEQREIVRRVEALFALADRLENRCIKGTAYVDKLTQATLAKAFAGRLVPTESDLADVDGRQFETAAELMTRIRSGSNSNGGSGIASRTIGKRRAS